VEGINWAEKDPKGMAISIKNEETERLARELAKRTGLSLTEAITIALREQLAREEGKRSASRIRDELLAIGRRCAALPDLDTRSPDDILGYDETGLPR
jgi:antitoxin VapB